MRASQSSSTSVSLVLPSEVRLIDLVHAAAEKMAEIAGFDADEALNIGLAMREAVINAIVHGNREDPKLRVEIGLSVRGRSFEARIRDQGPGFDPDQKADPTEPENLLNTSGRGILLMRAFVDEVEFRRRADRGMEIVLKKTRNGSSRQSSSRDR